MKKVELAARIIQILFIVSNIGCICFALMLLFMGTPHYKTFRDLSITLCFPMFFARVVFAQYIFTAKMLIFTVIKYIYAARAKSVSKADICIDSALWTPMIIELVFLENYFQNILWF